VKLVALIIFGLLSSFPYLTGRFYENADAQSNKTLNLVPGFSQYYGLDFHQVYPSYVFEAVSFLNSYPFYYRLFAFPSARTQSFKWGFSSNTDPLMESQKIGIITERFGEGFVIPDSFNDLERQLVTCLSHFETCSPTEFSELTQRFSVRFVLLRGDMLCTNKLVECSYDELEGYKAYLTANIPLVQVRNFGPWTLVELDVPPYVKEFNGSPVTSKNLEWINTITAPAMIYFSEVGRKSVTVPTIADWYKITLYSDGRLPSLDKLEPVDYVFEFSLNEGERILFVYSSFALFLAAFSSSIIILIILGVWFLCRKYW